MMKVELRDYQRQAIDGLHRAFSGADRPTGSGVSSRAAVVLPTGSGKTVIFAHPDFRNPIIGADRRMLVLVHRDELAAQAVAKVRAIDPSTSVGRVQGLWNETDRQVIVASVQTLARAPRRSLVENVGLVVVDECHHSLAPTYRKVMEHFGCFAEGGRAVPTAGFTATMTRSAEGEHLGNVWQEVVLRRDVVDGIRDGWLVDVRGRRVEIRGLDLGEVRKSRGDFSERDLGEHMMAADAPEQVAKAYVEEALDRQGIAFWPDLDSADQGAAAFRDHGIVTDVIKGETSIAEREAVYERFRRGRTQMLSSCMVLTEGFDMPQASAAVIARPTQSKGLFVQMAGRVLRPFHLPVPGYPPKRDALLLDVVGATSQHRLATIADLSVAVAGVGDDETLAQAADREAAEAGPAETRGGVPARHTVHDVDLFGDRSSVWLQTPRGTWFVPAGDYTVFLWPSEHGLWKIGVTLSKAGPGQAQQVADGMTMDWAMERAEAWATDICARTGVGNLSSRRAGWRRGGEASSQQVAYAQGLGARVPPGATKAQVSDLISTALAARALGG